MRKAVLAFCLAAFASLLALGGGGMMIGGRIGALAGGGVPTAKDYVQNGLIAMWDGIENAGWGVHDSNATTWKDLVSGLELYKHSGNNFVWNDKSIRIKNSVFRCDGLDYRIFNSDFCGESVVAKLETTDNYDFFWCISPQISSNRFFGLGTWEKTVYMPVLDHTGSGDGRAWVSGYDTNVLISVHQNSDGDVIVNNNKTWRITRSGNVKTVTSAKLFLGSYNGTSDILTDGIIGNLRLYSRILTAAEIAANYAVDKARFNLT